MEGRGGERGRKGKMEEESKREAEVRGGKERGKEGRKGWGGEEKEGKGGEDDNFLVCVGIKSDRRVF